MGFSVRKSRVRKSRKDDVEIFRIFCCSREGKRQIDKRQGEGARHRWETRCDCDARIECCLNRETNKIVIKEFIEEHNHELEPPETRHLLRSQREVSEVQHHLIDMAHDVGLRPTETYEFIVREAGGRDCVGHTIEDQKSYLRAKRQRQMQQGEAGAILTYFREKKMKNFSFFHDMQLDSDDFITNIFWADAEMIVDYQSFGDVVIFDTTYGTNKGSKPFGVFTGFNHHRMMIMFGASLLYDETVDSFVWLFETFLKCHGGRAIITIFTDQDAAMAKALRQVMPNTFHGLCTWHISQNATKHLAGHGSLLSDFMSCMFRYTDEYEFESAWTKMVSNENGTCARLWLDDIYRLKYKWAACYMKNVLTLGIRSTQLNECLNSNLKRHLRCNLNMRDFFNHFDRLLEKKRHNELVAEYESRQKMPDLILHSCPLMKQAAKSYTPTIFKKLQSELLDIPGLRIHSREGSVYSVVLSIAPDTSFKVYCDPANEIFECGCRLFETFGILCCHVLKVITTVEMTQIPKKYIMQRWTRTARGINSHMSTQETGFEEDLQTWSGRVASTVLHNALRIGGTLEGRAKLELGLSAINELVENFAAVHFDEGQQPRIVEIIDGNVKESRAVKRVREQNG